jgi:hypothetical protein
LPDTRVSEDDSSSPIGNFERVECRNSLGVEIWPVPGGEIFVYSRWRDTLRDHGDAALELPPQEDLRRRASRPRRGV